MIRCTNSAIAKYLLIPFFYYSKVKEVIERLRKPSFTYTFVLSTLEK